MKVSIGIPAYNCEKTIERAIRSVISQTYQDWHIYIVNDASTDTTAELLLNYSDVKNISIINNVENLGVAESRNRIIDSSNGDCIAFLDSDDEWHPDKLKEQIKLVNLGYGAVISDYYFITETKSVSINSMKNEIVESDLLKKNIRICFSSVLYKRDLLESKEIRFEKIGHEDFLFLYEIMKSFGKIGVVRKALVNYYVTNGSLSNNKKNAAKWHFSILNMLFSSKVKVLFYFLYYIINALKFKSMIRKAGERQ